MTTKKPTFLPLYQQIKGLITQRLSAGEWSPGSAIPSEMELASEFNVSQGTVRKAIDELAAEHILYRRQGKGTFVATHTDRGQKYRFLRLVPAAGERPYPASELLSFEQSGADSAVASALDVRPGDPVWVIKRRLRFSGKIVLVDQIWLPVASFRDLDAAQIEDLWARRRGTLYGFYETNFGQRILRGDERLSAIPLSADEAALLEQPEGAPVLQILRTAFTYDHRAVEYRRSLCNTSELYYFSQLT